LFYMVNINFTREHNLGWSTLFYMVNINFTREHNLGSLALNGE